MPTLNFLTNRCPRIFTLGQPLSLSVPALFLGDSKYDYQAASAAGLDFVFLSGWSEVESGVYNIIRERVDDWLLSAFGYEI